MGKIWSGKTLMNVNTKPFSNVLPPIISFYTQLYSAAIHAVQFINILQSNWFGLNYSPIFYPTKIFPHTVIATISYIILAIVYSIAHQNLVYLQNRNVYSYSNYLACDITYMV